MTPTTSFITRCRSALRARGEWTRREFLRGAAGVVALPHLPSGVAAAQFAYVASGEGVLHVFSLRGEQLTRIQRVPSRAPACVLLSPSQRTLYVTNEVDVHEGLPRGTVEAYHVDSLDGRLTLLSRQPLSLSATLPRHMALSPGSKAACSGGVRRRNLQPLLYCEGREPWTARRVFLKMWAAERSRRIPIRCFSMPVDATCSRPILPAIG